MHAGSVYNSNRLWNTYVALKLAGAEGLTTREIQRRTGSQAVHSDIAALRDQKNAYEIACRYDHRDPETGAKVYRYTLNRKGGDSSEG